MGNDLKGLFIISPLWVQRTEKVIKLRKGLFFCINTQTWRRTRSREVLHYPADSMTTCAAAIKAWEEKTGTPSSEADSVQLYCQMPPIQKLDNTLNGLTKCEHLALSTNAIERLIPLGGMTKLRVLSVGRNNLKRFEKLEENAESLKEIWASYNQISSLDGLSCLPELEVLYLSNNAIKDWSELEKLSACTKLKDILLVGNPCYDDVSPEEARIKVLQHMSANKALVKIDNILIKPKEREEAAAV